MNYVVIRDHHEVAETPLESLKSNRLLSAKQVLRSKSQIVDLKFLGGLKKINQKNRKEKEYRNVPRITENLKAQTVINANFEPVNQSIQSGRQF